MRRIKISIEASNNPNSLIMDEKLYTFPLPNGAKIAFSNKRNFITFISESERMFTDLIYEWNELMMDLYAEYRTWYLNLSLEQESQFEGNFSEIRRIMNKCFRSGSFGNNGIAYLYNDSKNIVELLFSILAKLELLMKSMNNYSKTRKYRIIKDRLDHNKLQLKNWGWQHHKPWGKFKELNISYYENEYFKSYSIKSKKD